jgi:hypothetical protein
LKNLAPGTTWQYLKVYQKQPDGRHQMIKYTKPTAKVVYPEFASRASDLTLTASQNGTIVTAIFTLANLNRTTDEREYSLRLQHSLDDSDDSTETLLTVLGKRYRYF